MKKVLGALLLVCVGGGWAWSDPPGAIAKAPSVSDTVKQTELEWTEALKAGDVDKVSQIIADDWRAIGAWPAGKIETKASVLAGLRSGKMKVESMEFSDWNVKVIGDVAIVQGIDIEKSTMNGKESSGKYAWTDVLAKRKGKWVAVRSQAAKME